MGLFGVFAYCDVTLVCFVFGYLRFRCVVASFFVGTCYLWCYSLAAGNHGLLVSSV